MIESVTKTYNNASDYGSYDVTFVKFEKSPCVVNVVTRAPEVIVSVYLHFTKEKSEIEAHSADYQNSKDQCGKLSLAAPRRGVIASYCSRRAKRYLPLRGLEYRCHLASLILH